MSLIRDIRHEMRELGIRPEMKNEISDLGVELTVCQMVIVSLSLASVVFLFVPLIFSQNIRFVIIFFIVSLLFLISGMWFWVKRADMCESPGDFRD